MQEFHLMGEQPRTGVGLMVDLTATKKIDSALTQ